MNKMIVKTFDNIDVRDTLKLSFRRTSTSKLPPTFSGVELIAQATTPP